MINPVSSEDVELQWKVRNELKTPRRLLGRKAKTQKETSFLRSHGQDLAKNSGWRIFVPKSMYKVSSDE